MKIKFSFYFISPVCDIHLYGMDKAKFYSELFGREIHKSEPEYKQKAIAEALYRLYKLEKDNCTCMQCRSDLTKLKKYLSDNLSFQ